MKKEPKYSKVNILPIITGIITKEKLEQIKLRFPGQPNNMDYRKEFLRGRGASLKDKTWSIAKHKHVCCGSPVPWRHRAKCKIVKALNSDDLSDLI